MGCSDGDWGSLNAGCYRYRLKEPYRTETSGHKRQSREFIRESLNPAVSHGPKDRNIEMLATQGAGSACCAGDVSSSGPEYGSIIALSSARAKFEHGAAFGCAYDPGGFGGDQALVVDGNQEHGFDHLGLDDRTAHLDNRLMREIGVPSGMAQTSQVNLNWRKNSMNRSSNSSWLPR